MGCQCNFGHELIKEKHIEILFIFSRLVAKTPPSSLSVLLPRVADKAASTSVNLFFVTRSSSSVMLFKCILEVVHRRRCHSCGVSASLRNSLLEPVSYTHLTLPTSDLV